MERFIDGKTETEPACHDITLIEPPMFSSDGQLNIGQASSCVVLDTIDRYCQLTGKSVSHRHSSFNGQGKPIESRIDLPFPEFIAEAERRSMKLVEAIEQQKRKIGICPSETRYLDFSPESQAITQREFIRLYQKGFLIRTGDQFLLDVTKIVREGTAEKALEGIRFFPQSVKEVFGQLLKDATYPVKMTKSRLFSTPIPFHICEKCDELSLPETALPTDPRLIPSTCEHCGNASTNNQRATIAPLFDLTQQYRLLNRDHAGETIMVCGRNVITKYAFFTFLTGVALDGRSPFDTLIAHGLLNDHRGKRMSRRNGNVVALENLDYHPDAIRYATIKSITFNSQESRFNYQLLGVGQKLVYRIGNLKRFFDKTVPEWIETQDGLQLPERYHDQMARFDLKGALTTAEKAIKETSVRIKRANDQRLSLDLQEEFFAFQTALVMMSPFMPEIVSSQPK